MPSLPGSRTRFAREGTCEKKKGAPCGEKGQDHFDKMLLAGVQFHPMLHVVSKINLDPIN